VPDERLSTAEARGALPDQVPRDDAVANISRTAGLVAVLTGAVEATPERLLACTEDRIHQPYRASLMPRTSDVVAALREAGIPAAVSGAGPSVLCLVAAGHEDSVREASGTLDGWKLLELDWDSRGAYIEGE
jgi:homoserine kinase